MNLALTPYAKQHQQWPETGRVILAQFDDESIVVYQAYRPAIGQFAAKNNYFGGPFKLSRMSWIKPNFLWMMHRCGWASKEGQENVLAVHLKRSAFDHILAQAVHSSFKRSLYPTREAWQASVSQSDVRIQWDPDHDPKGKKVERRAIQLGLRGDAIKHYAKEWILKIEDITDFVTEQHAHASSGNYEQLLTPTETPYPVSDPNTRHRLLMLAESE